MNKIKRYIFNLYMKTIYKNSSNTVRFTLNEKTTLTEPIYIFTCKIRLDDEVILCVLGTDNSDNVNRYNEFIIIEKTSPDNTLNEISLSVGEYDYTIYQSTTSSLDDQVGIVEVGKLIVKDTESQDIVEPIVKEITFE